MASHKPEDSNEIPCIVENSTLRKKYKRGRFLGKGGFAKCYELIDTESHQVFAGKIVAKSQLTKPHHKEKMSLEIAIHRSISHKNIIRFYGFFEDKNYIYILLELCARRSLMEMHRRRRTLTEPEVRYFVRQIVQACAYLHENKIIHRDLKLGNLLLNSDMELKVGDFGLATRLDFSGERKKTLCGTPNYIAPEVLGKKGHSFEVDVWSLGCIVYTLVVGKPPFETSSLKDTYTRIKRNEYRIPSRVTPETREFIQKLLRSDPSQRPSMTDILHDPYLTKSYIPSRIPVSCLSTEPRMESRLSLCSFSALKISPRRPLKDVNKADELADSAPVKPNKGGQMTTQPHIEVVSKATQERNDALLDSEKYLSQLMQQLISVVNSKPSEKAVIEQGEAEDPAAIPIFWISKWVDYSDKYGLGYQLCDNSVGVLFNDNTRIVLLTDGKSFQYIEKNGTEEYHSLESHPPSIKKKVTLLNYFRNYMNEHLLKTGEAIAPREGDEMTRLPYLFSWFRSRNAIVLYLTNGTVQVNFFEDHTKIILCPLMGAVTYIDRNSEFKTYRLKLIEKHGCTRELDLRLKYAKGIVDKLMSKGTAGKVKTQS